MSTKARDGRKDGWRQRARIAVFATVITLVVRLLGATWRVHWKNREVVDARRTARLPIVFAIWHGELLPLLWAHRGQGVVVVVSTHADGEIITRVLEALGFETVRGSSSRGGARALLEATRRLRGGYDIAVTPDGPRGPRRVFAPGAVVAAMRADVPVIAAGAHVDRAWHLRSWDRLVIPKPFAKVGVHYSNPLVPRAASARDAEQEAERFGALLSSVSAPDRSDR